MKIKMQRAAGASWAFAQGWADARKFEETGTNNANPFMADTEGYAQYRAGREAFRAGAPKPVVEEPADDGLAADEDPNLIFANRLAGSDVSQGRLPFASLASRVQVGAQDAPVLAAMASLPSVKGSVKGLEGERIVRHILTVGQMDRGTRQRLTEALASGDRKEAKDAHGYDWEHGDWALFTNWNGAKGIVRVVNNKSTAWVGGPRDSHVDVAFNQAAWDLGAGMSPPQGTPVERHQLAPLPPGTTPSYREASVSKVAVEGDREIIAWAFDDAGIEDSRIDALVTEFMAQDSGSAEGLWTRAQEWVKGKTASRRRQAAKQVLHDTRTLPGQTITVTWNGGRAFTVKVDGEEHSTFDVSEVSDEVLVGGETSATLAAKAWVRRNLRTASRKQAAVGDTCPSCGGKGYYRTPMGSDWDDPYNEQWMEVSCSTCGGSGVVNEPTDYPLADDPIFTDRYGYEASRRTAAQAARPLHQIADEIRADWKNVYFGAVPYLDAMTVLDSIDDHYGQDSARSIVAHFLSNASSWRGDKARAIKKELKALSERRTAGFLDGVKDMASRLREDVDLTLPSGQQRPLDREVDRRRSQDDSFKGVMEDLERDRREEQDEARRSGETQRDRARSQAGRKTR